MAPRSALFYTAAITLTLVPLVVSALGTITYRNCTDRALCLSGCAEATVATNQCFATGGGAIMSEIIRCIPTLRVCGDLSYFSDALCTNLMFTDGFICDQCNQGNNNGGFNEATCSRGVDGLEFLALSACGSDSTCTTCNNYQNVTAGQCIPIDQGTDAWKLTIARTAYGTSALSSSSGQLWAKYTGAVTCNGVSMEQWTSNDQCASNPARAPIIPENSCINGASIHCNWL
jgi:hypothetical protein